MTFIERRKVRLSPNLEKLFKERARREGSATYALTALLSS